MAEDLSIRQGQQAITKRCYGRAAPGHGRSTSITGHNRCSPVGFCVVPIPAMSVRNKVRAQDF
jgi:hypothetical protein